MNKQHLIVILLLTAFGSLFAQFVEYPGESSIGYGYNIFKDYASNTSTLEQVFEFGEDRNNRLGFSIPDIIGITNLGMNKQYDVTEGNSLKQYAYELSSKVSLGIDAIAFSASVETRFGKSSSETSSNYFYTVSDITQAYTVYVKRGDLRRAREILTEDARDAIENWPVQELIDTFGTHVVVKGIMGGRMELNLTKSFSNRSLRVGPA